MTRGALKLLPLSGLLWAASCVVPVEPQFSDPGYNIPPYLSYAHPPIGAWLDEAVEADIALLAEVQVGDQNSQDVLWVRWLIDYPASAGDYARMAMEQALPTTGHDLRSPFRFSPSCIDDNLSGTGPLHRLLLAVTDRPFSSEPDAAPDSPSPGAFVFEATWPFRLECK